MTMSGKQEKTSALGELAVQAKHGDRAALDQLLGHQELKRVIYKIANAKVGQTNADDVYQEVLISISQKIHTWQGEAEITTWADRITRNACVDFLRRAKPNRLLLMETTPDNMVEPDQLQTCSVQEMLEITQEMLLKMGSECQKLLNPFLIEGVEKKKIMAMVELPRATFHRKWKGCYEVLVKKIQNFCNFSGKTLHSSPSHEQ
jgi:RNA polymerase sigma-70 factor (ECF subfamily)